MWLETPEDWIIATVTIVGLLAAFALIVVSLMVKCDEYQLKEDDENDYGKDPS